PPPSIQLGEGPESRGQVGRGRQVELGSRKQQADQVKVSVRDRGHDQRAGRQTPALSTRADQTIQLPCLADSDYPTARDGDTIRPAPARVAGQRGHAPFDNQVSGGGHARRAARSSSGPAPAPRASANPTRAFSAGSRDSITPARAQVAPPPGKA